MLNNLKYSVLLCVVFSLSGCQTIGSGNAEIDRLQAEVDQCWKNFGAQPALVIIQKYVPEPNDPDRVRKMSSTKPAPPELLESYFELQAKADECTEAGINHLNASGQYLYVPLLLDTSYLRIKHLRDLATGKYSTVGQFASDRYDAAISSMQAWQQVSQQINNQNAREAAAIRIEESRREYKQQYDFLAPFKALIESNQNNATQNTRWSETRNGRTVWCSRFGNNVTCN